MNIGTIFDISFCALEIAQDSRDLLIHLIHKGFFLLFLRPNDQQTISDYNIWLDTLTYACRFPAAFAM